MMENIKGRKKVMQYTVGRVYYLNETYWNWRMGIQTPQNWESGATALETVFV